MNSVDAIKNKKDIDTLKRYLRGKKNLRDYVLFVCGINLGLRIGDLLSLKVGDIHNKERLTIRQQKTSKIANLVISDTVKKAVSEYINVANLKEEDFLFKSRTGDKPITRSQAHRVLSEAATACKIKNISCHSLRKTFGFQLYSQGVDLTRVARLLSHSSVATTMFYLGITQSELDEAVLKLNL